MSGGGHEAGAVAPGEPTSPSQLASKATEASHDPSPGSDRRRLEEHQRLGVDEGCGVAVRVTASRLGVPVEPEVKMIQASSVRSGSSRTESGWCRRWPGNDEVRRHDRGDAGLPEDDPGPLMSGRRGRPAHRRNRRPGCRELRCRGRAAGDPHRRPDRHARPRRRRGRRRCHRRRRQRGIRSVSRPLSSARVSGWAATVARKMSTRARGSGPHRRAGATGDRHAGILPQMGERRCRPGTDRPAHLSRSAWRSPARPAPAPENVVGEVAQAASGHAVVAGVATTRPAPTRVVATRAPRRYAAGLSPSAAGRGERRGPGRREGSR